MNSILGSKERESFSDRLKGALEAAGFPTSPSKFAVEFNLRADGAAVSVHGVRKWLLGEAIPAQERIQILADWLGISAAWLRFGDAENTVVPPAHSAQHGLESAELALVHDVRLLSSSDRALLRSIIDTMLRHAIESKRNSGEIRSRSRRSRPD